MTRINKIKIKLLLCSLIALLNGNIHAQTNTETIIKDIRAKYQLINQNRLNYDTKVEDYDWEKEEIVPNLTEEQLDHEYNEYGNYIIRKTVYIDKNKEVKLIEIDENIEYYQENSRTTNHKEYYFGFGKLIFYYCQVETYINFKKNASEERVYIHNGEVIRYLTKEIEGQGIEALNGVKNSENDSESCDWGALTEYKDNIKQIAKNNWDRSVYIESADNNSLVTDSPDTINFNTERNYSAQISDLSDYKRDSISFSISNEVYDFDFTKKHLKSESNYINGDYKKGSIVKYFDKNGLKSLYIVYKDSNIVVAENYYLKNKNLAHLFWCRIEYAAPGDIHIVKKEYKTYFFYNSQLIVYYIGKERITKDIDPAIGKEILLKFKKLTK